MQNEIREYVNQQIRAGTNIQIIIDQLKAQGIDDDSINHAFSAVMNGENPEV